MALREHQKEKAERRVNRAAEKKEKGTAEPLVDPETQLPLSPEEQELAEFRAALKERAAQEALEAERDLQRKK